MRYLQGFEERPRNLIQGHCNDTTVGKTSHPSDQEARKILRVRVNAKEAARHVGREDVQETKTLVGQILQGKGNRKQPGGTYRGAVHQVLEARAVSFRAHERPVHPPALVVYRDVNPAEGRVRL